MPKAKSEDLRQAILHALENGAKQKDIVEMLGISASSVLRYKRQYEQTGSLAPRPCPGNRACRKLTDELRQVVIAWIDAEPDLILPVVAQRLLDQYHVSITPSQISRTLIQLGYSRKKTPRSTHVESEKTSLEND